MNNELESFKQDIHLGEYAQAEFDFELNRQASSRNSLVMQTINKSDKIIITKMSDGHYCYFSVYNHADNGSIIDLIQNRLSLTLGQVRQKLRPWLNRSTSHSNIKSFIPPIQTATIDQVSILKIYNSLNDLSESQYLKCRAVGKEVLLDERFMGKIKIDEYQNIVFPHLDHDGVCGLEKHNFEFKGFEKGLWSSNRFKSDTAIVICESPIDCLSYHALKQPKFTRYASFGGGWSDKTATMVKLAVTASTGLKVVLAFDNDDAGRQYEEYTKALLKDLDVDIDCDYPPEHCNDWNDVLCSDIV